MKGTRFKPIIRECLGQLNREVKIALTPVPKNKTWLFLVGCYNSGTTLLSELLSHHPEISALPTEGHFITDQFIKDYEIGIPRMWVDREDIFCLTEKDHGPDPIRIKKEWGMRLNLNKQVLVEKSPPNSAKTRWLQANFENTHFVGIIRNGYAVAEGISRKADPQHQIASWPIEKSAYQWSRSNEILRTDSKHLKNFMWIKYEDLTKNPELVLNQIAKFVKIKKFDNISNNQKWSIHERDEPIKNMNESSIAKLSTAQIGVINSIAGDALDSFGYRRLK